MNPRTILTALLLACAALPAAAQDFVYLFPLYKKREK